MRTTKRPTTSHTSQAVRPQQRPDLSGAAAVHSSYLFPLDASCYAVLQLLLKLLQLITQRLKRTLIAHLDSTVWQDWVGIGQEGGG